MAKEDNETPAAEKKEGVHLSEEFQQEAHELVHNATKKECSYIRDCLNEREDALRKEEMSKEKPSPKGKSAVKAPAEYEADSSY